MRGIRPNKRPFAKIKRTEKRKKTSRRRLEGLVWFVCCLLIRIACYLVNELYRQFSMLVCLVLTKYTDKISNDHNFIFYFTFIYYWDPMWTIWTIRKWYKRRLGTINDNNKIKYIQICERGPRFSFFILWLCWIGWLFYNICITWSSFSTNFYMT